MRFACVLAAALFAITTSPARADGVYFAGALGPGWLRSADGQHSDVNTETARTRAAIGVRAGNWAIEPFVATELTNASNPSTTSPALTDYGIDLKRVMPVSRTFSIYVRGSMSHLAYPDQAPCCLIDDPGFRGPSMDLYGYGGRGLGLGAGAQLAFHIAGLRGAAYVEDSYDYYRLLPPQTVLAIYRPAIDVTVVRLSFGLAIGSDF